MTVEDVKGAFETSQPWKPSPSDDDNRKPSQLKVLIDQTKQLDIFQNYEGDSFVTYNYRGNEITCPVKQKSLRSYLMQEYYKKMGKPPSSTAVKDLIDFIDATAELEGKKQHVFIRTGNLGENIYIDLCNDDYEVVEINTAGWRVIRNPPIKFYRPKGMLPLPSPERGGKVDELKQFFNVDSDEFILIVSYIIAALTPTGPFPILILQGEQGTGKSFLSRLLGSIISPTIASLLSPPKEFRDLMVVAKSQWFMPFDNLSGLKPWLSDSLCKLATGGGLMLRKLFSDGDSVIFNAKRPMCLNGIDEIPTRGDVRDRAIIISMAVIPDNKRLDERKLLADFELARPRITGAFYDVMSSAIKNLPNVKLTTAPRMADFAKLVTAAEQGLGWKSGSFMDCYLKNRAQANELSIDMEPVAKAIKDLIVNRDGFRGTATQILDKINENTPFEIQKSKSWPKTPRTLSDQLRRIAPDLRALGFIVEFARAGKGGSRQWVLKSNVIRVSNHEDAAQIVEDKTKRELSYTDEGVVSADDDQMSTLLNKTPQGGEKIAADATDDKNGTVIVDVFAMNGNNPSQDLE